MNEFYNKHYICTDASGNIVDGWSNGSHNRREVTEADILLNDRGGYQFRLFPGGEENPILHTIDAIPLYRWTGSEVVRRTEEEIAADLASMEAERIANATETVLLEMAAEHEERLCMLEMGVSDNDL